MLFSPVFVYTEPRSANQNSRLFTLLALSFEGSLEGHLSAPAIVAARPTRPPHFSVSLSPFPASLNPFRPLPLRAPKSRRINTYGISRKCLLQTKNLQDR